jgi:hypothetical protein
MTTITVTAFNQPEDCTNEIGIIRHSAYPLLGKAVANDILPIAVARKIADCNWQSRATVIRVFPARVGVGGGTACRTRPCSPLHSCRTSQVSAFHPLESFGFIRFLAGGS